MSQMEVGTAEQKVIPRLQSLPMPVEKGSAVNSSGGERSNQTISDRRKVRLYTSCLLTCPSSEQDTTRMAPLFFASVHRGSPEDKSEDV